MTLSYFNPNSNGETPPSLITNPHDGVFAPDAFNHKARTEPTKQVNAREYDDLIGQHVINAEPTAQGRVALRAAGIPNMEWIGDGR